MSVPVASWLNEFAILEVTEMFVVKLVKVMVFFVNLFFCFFSK